mmetsp:Transcript_22204/g.59923  ORF Transcript_22204/g.59923 Transcript_22204/m.59923 type:complete len:245 (+) Transcript_22204:188-922(+)
MRGAPASVVTRVSIRRCVAAKADIVSVSVHSGRVVCMGHTVGSMTFSEACPVPMITNRVHSKALEDLVRDHVLAVVLVLGVEQGDRNGEDYTEHDAHDERCGDRHVCHLEAEVGAVKARQHGGCTALSQVRGERWEGGGVGDLMLHLEPRVAHACHEDDEQKEGGTEHGDVKVDHILDDLLQRVVKEPPHLPGETKQAVAHGHAHRALVDAIHSEHDRLGAVVGCLDARELGELNLLPGACTST